MVRSLCLLSLLLVALLGCTPPRPVDDRPLPPGLLETMQSRLGQVDSQRGMTKVKLTRDGKGSGANQVLILQRPDRFYSETLSMFGPPVAVSTGDGTVVSLYLPGKRELYQSFAGAREMERLFGIPVNARELVELFLYDPPIAELSGRPVWNGEGFVLKADDARLLVSPEGDLLEYAAPLSDALELQVRYADFRGDDRLPRRIELRCGDAVVEAILDDETEYNVSIEPSRFVLSVPDGTTRYWW